MMGQFIQRTINKLVDNDEYSRRRVIDMAGTRFKVTISDLPQQPARIIEALSSGYVSIVDDPTADVDCSLSGTARNYLKVVQSDKGESSLKGLHIEGDVGSAMEFARFAQNLDFDWESLLEPRLGRFATRQISVIAGALGTLRKDMSTRSKRVMSEAIIDELRVSPSRTELEIEGERIEALNKRLDELEKKIS